MQSLKIFLAALVLSAVLFSCSSSDEHQSETAEPAISDSLIKHVPTAPVTEEDVADIIKLNGKIEPNESKQAKVFALVSGKIQSVAVELGDYVRKGQVLAVLQSTEVAGINNDLSLAKANVDLAEKSLQAKKDLFEGNLATSQEYNSARIEYNKALSELNRARQVASIAGGKSASYTLTAPISGYIITKNITGNSEVRSDNNTELFEVADLSDVWIVANVYESDIANVEEGEAVTVKTLARPDKEYEGKIDKIYNVLDPATRTMKVRISMKNTGNELKPEMFATVMVKGNVTGRMPAIPSKAVVMENSRFYVVVRAGNKLEVKEISIIRRIGDKTFISGLSEGEQVVTEGQVFLYEALSDN